MKNYVIINGVNSLTITGLAISKLPSISKPPLRVMTEEINGRDGDLITELGYGAYDKELVIGLYGNYDINEVIGFFNQEGTIVFSNEDDKYYNFKIINQIDYEALIKFRTATINLHCQPFKYPLTETPEEITTEYVEEEGETLTLNDTKIAPLSIDLKGNTTQNGTPTPSSPIPVNVVSGDNEIEVCGKNLLNIQGIVKGRLDNGVIGYESNTTSLTTDDNTISFTTNANYRGITSDYINIKSSQYIIVSWNNATTTPVIAIAYYDKNKNFISQIAGGYYLTNGTRFANNITNARFIRVYISLNTSGTTTIDKPQLNYTDSDRFPYEPYTSQNYPLYLGVENLYEGSQDFSGTWNNASGWTTDSSTYNGLVVKKREGTWNGLSKDINVEAGKTYTFSLYAKADSNATADIYISIGGTATTNPANAYNKQITTSWQRFSVPFTCTASGIIKARLEKNSASSGNYIYICGYQLEEGSKANSYTPYGTTPIELNKIGNYQDRIFKTSGKNLLDTNFNTTTLNGITFTYNNDKTITIKGTSTASANVVVGTATLQAGTYIASANMQYAWGKSRIEISGSGSTIALFNTNKSNTITLTEQTTLTFRAIVSGTGTIVDYTIGIMLEKGNSSSTYEPYGSGKWYLHKEVGKVVLDGSENWAKGSSRPFYTLLINDILRLQSAGNNATLFCNYLSPSTPATIWENNINGITNLNDGNAIRIRIQDNPYTITTFKEWLNDVKPVVYYVLSTPTEEEITNSNLINQLEALKGAMSYEGQTNISQVNNDLPFILKVKGIKEGSGEGIITNIGNIYAKPIIALEGTGNIGIYKNGTQYFEVDMSSDNEITIDTEKMEAYHNGVLKNRKVIGDYNKFTIDEGNNNIEITGELTKATISNYTRWL